MAESGEALGADLYSLLQVANTFLPILSDIYTDAKQGVVAARSSLEHVMARPAYFGGGTYGPIYQPWADLEAQTIKIVDEMISDLNDAATALNLTVRSYESTDAAAAAEVNKEIGYKGYPNAGGAH